MWTEQYTIRANIEAETTASMARATLLPAALRYLALVEAAGIDGVAGEARALIEEFITAIEALEAVNAYPDDTEGLNLAIYARDKH